jgi:hypothetical protein
LQVYLALGNKSKAFTLVAVGVLAKGIPGVN